MKNNTKNHRKNEFINAYMLECNYYRQQGLRLLMQFLLYFSVMP